MGNWARATWPAATHLIPRTPLRTRNHLHHPGLVTAAVSLDGLLVQRIPARHRCKHTSAVGGRHSASNTAEHGARTWSASWRCPLLAPPRVAATAAEHTASHHGLAQHTHAATGDSPLTASAAFISSLGPMTPDAVDTQRTPADDQQPAPAWGTGLRMDAITRPRATRPRRVHPAADATARKAGEEAKRHAIVECCAVLCRAGKDCAWASDDAMIKSQIYQDTCRHP